MNILNRLSQLAPIAFAGLLYISSPQAAVAVEAPIQAAQPMEVSPSAPVMTAYYYRGRRYPYRYHGMYFGHRYYRYGRYHYY
jgi:hypothetical protein